MHMTKVEVMLVAGLAVRVKAHQVAFGGCDLQLLTLVPLSLSLSLSLTLEPETSLITSLSPSLSENTFVEKILISQCLTSPSLQILKDVCDLEVDFF